jgi:hypothetical protein
VTIKDAQDQLERRFCLTDTVLRVYNGHCFCALPLSGNGSQIIRKKGFTKKYGRSEYVSKNRLSTRGEVITYMLYNESINLDLDL